MALKCGAALAVVVAFTGAAEAATIYLIDIGGVTGSQAEKGFKTAAAYWGPVLSNNVTINLGVGFAALDPGAIGETGSSAMDVMVVNWKSGVPATSLRLTVGPST
jgi:hypothetical protein